jgi:hypothetical protein
VEIDWHSGIKQLKEPLSDKNLAEIEKKARLFPIEKPKGLGLGLF